MDVKVGIGEGVERRTGERMGGWREGWEGWRSKTTKGWKRKGEQRKGKRKVP